MADDKLSASSAGQEKVSLTYDQREDIIFNLQRVGITDWYAAPDGRPLEIREVTAAFMLDCVLSYINKLSAPSSARLAADDGPILEAQEVVERWVHAVEECAMVVKAKHDELAKRAYPPPAILMTLVEEIRALKGTPSAAPGARLAIPEGWKLVPFEPTDEMLDAMENTAGATAAYKAVLNAAPQAPVEAGTGRSPAQPADAALERWTATFAYSAGRGGATLEEGECREVYELLAAKRTAPSAALTGEQIGWLCHHADGGRHFIWKDKDEEGERAWLQKRYVRWEPLYACSATGHTAERLPANQRHARRLNEDGSVTPACIFRKGCQKVATCVAEQRCCANEGGPDAVSSPDRGAESS